MKINYFGKISKRKKEVYSKRKKRCERFFNAENKAIINSVYG